MPERFPKRVYGTGEEPDPRFSLANERTFLAWIRTALALLAAGVALEALRIPEPPEFRLTAALLFIVLGVLAAAQAWFGWARTERAMRENRALPAPTLSIVISVGVVIGVGVFVVGLFV